MPKVRSRAATPDRLVYPSFCTGKVHCRGGASGATALRAGGNRGGQLGQDAFSAQPDRVLIKICDIQAAPCMMCKASSCGLPSAPSRWGPCALHLGGSVAVGRCLLLYLLVLLLPRGELCTLRGTQGRQKLCVSMPRLTRTFCARQHHRPTRSTTLGGAPAERRILCH